MSTLQTEINIYTDGSCDPSHKTGGWAAILLIEGQKIILTGKETETTHNRMELLAIIRALEYITMQDMTRCSIIIHSDSQYAVSLIDRRKKLIAADFMTKKNSDIRNEDLVKLLFSYIDSLHPVFKKVKAHQRKTESENYNRDADKLARKTVRDHVRGHYSD